MDITLFFGSLAVLIVGERAARVRFARLPLLRPHVATDLVYLATGAVALALLIRDALFRLTGVTGVLLPASSALPAPVSLLLAIVLYDLAAYATHLLLHRSERLWRFHKVHHSSPVLDWLATFRAHFVEHALRHVASSGLLITLGFPLWSVAAAAAVNGVWAAFVHANLRLDLGSIEFVFITPRLHRLHHVASSGERNLGTLFSLWDRWRGNLLSASDVPLDPLGVPGEIETYPQSWLRQMVEPFRSQVGAVGESGTVTALPASRPSAVASAADPSS